MLQTVFQIYKILGSLGSETGYIKCRGWHPRTISSKWKIYMLKTVCKIYKILGSFGKCWICQQIMGHMHKTLFGSFGILYIWQTVFSIYTSYFIYILRILYIWQTVFSIYTSYFRYCPLTAASIYRVSHKKLYLVYLVRQNKVFFVGHPVLIFLPGEINVWHG